ncbi:MAG: TetR family transcriptional regulator [Asticcacaulis sp.]
MIAEEGLEALTLRPLANRLSMGLSSLTYRFETKDALLTFLIETARQSEAGTLQLWQSRLEGLVNIAPDDLAEITDAILSDLVIHHRDRTLLYCELVQLSSPQPDLWSRLQPWVETRLSFWVDLADRIHPKPAYDLGPAVQAYVTDELAHALALEEISAYRRLRRLGLKRLFRGLVSSPSSAGDAVLADVCIKALGELPGDLMIDHHALEPKGKASAWVRHIADLIVEQGAGAVTHRAAAARANIAASTLAYHFKTQDDLLRAGLEDIIRRLTRGVQAVLTNNQNGASSPDAAVEIARATYAIALWATRRPTMLACAADMRRLRGINLYKILSNRLEGLDPLSAQAMSIAGIGALMLNGHRGPAEAADANFKNIERLTTAFIEKPS